MILAENLSKRFKLYRTPADRLREILWRRPYHHVHTALDGVSFRLGPGEALGIIGENGAGKSTLLKILSGVLLPDGGRLRIDGRVTGLLELGTGFDYTLTGLENIYTNGLLLGMEKEEIASRRDQIVAFAELGEYIAEPLRTYSSGMVMRLAFAVAIHADPQCFLVDEALSVGDAYFQQKCMRRIRRFREGGGSILFVSHDLNAVKMICDRVLVLEKGRVAAEGAPEEAVNYYNRLIARSHDASPFQVGAQDYGSREVEILEACFQGEGSGSTVVSSGENARLRVLVQGRRRVENVTLGFLIRDRFGQDVFGTNTFHLGRSLSLGRGQRLAVEFVFPVELAPGKYTVTVALHSEADHLETCYHWRDQLLQFEVAGVRGPLFAGVCRLPVRLRMERSDAAATA